MTDGNRREANSLLDPKPNDIENPFKSLVSTMATSPNDWSLSSRESWLYGIVCGWGKSIDAVAVHHGWKPRDVRRLKRLHSRFTEVAESFKMDEE